MLSEELAEKRNKLLQEVRQEKDKEYRSGYVDGILDMYNEGIKEKKELVNAI